MTVPTYQLITPGGDTQLLGNFEYRIPIIGPVTLAPFFDAGVDKILRTSQLTLDPTRVSDLNTQFPQAGFTGKVYIAPGTQKMRASTGLELQVMLPVVQRAVPPVLRLQSLDRAGVSAAAHRGGPGVVSQQRHVSQLDCNLRPGVSVL